MLLYCLKCRKNTESKNPRVAATKNQRIELLSNWKKYIIGKNQNLSKSKKLAEY